MVDLSDNSRDLADFGLGISVSPVWSSDHDLDLMVATARVASEFGASLFLAGDKTGGTPEARSNAVILGWLLGELAGVARIGSLFLVRQTPPPILTAQLRTLVQAIARQGSTPIVGVMQGREPADSDLPGWPVEETVAAVRRDPVTAAAELWVAAEQGPALERAGRIGEGWLANGYYDPEALAGQMERVAAAAGRPVRSAVRRDFVVSAQSRKAHSRARDLLAGGYRNGKFTETSLISGDPQACLERFAQLAELGFGDIVVRPALDGPESVEQLQMLFECWRSSKS